MIEKSAILQSLRSFLYHAERAWFDIYNSSNERESIIYDGTEFVQLPLRFSTKAKIYSYFRKYWSPSFSEVLMSTLQPIVCEGRVYVILGDPGPIPDIVESVRIVKTTKTQLSVRAVLSGDPDGNVVIMYTLAKTSGGYRIVQRTGTKNDYRFDASVD